MTTTRWETEYEQDVSGRPFTWIIQCAWHDPVPGGQRPFRTQFSKIPLKHPFSPRCFHTPSLQPIDGRPRYTRSINSGTVLGHKAYSISTRPIPRFHVRVMLQRLEHQDLIEPIHLHTSSSGTGHCLTRCTTFTPYFPRNPTRISSAKPNAVSDKTRRVRANVRS